jgi:hypothetical protein
MTILEAINNYVACLNKAHEGNYTYSVEINKVYARITKTGSGNNSSVHTFVSRSKGDILFAAGYKAPSKRIVGSIFNDDPLVGTSCYGGNYAR